MQHKNKHTYVALNIFACISLFQLVDLSEKVLRNEIESKSTCTLSLIDGAKLLSKGMCSHTRLHPLQYWVILPI